MTAKFDSHTGTSSTTKDIVKDQQKLPDREYKIIWPVLLWVVYVHLAGIYGSYLVFTRAKIVTFIFAISYAYTCALGITAGAHRLWSHKSYKAKWPMRLVLMLLNCGAFQQSIYHWVRDHRVHHKFTDTDADPYNAARGFFFSHIGWVMVEKHPDVKKKGKLIDMSDIMSDPFIAWQHRFYYSFASLIAFVLPTLIPWYFFGESLWNSWHVATIYRYAISLNFTWLVNSAAHMWGSKPYDRNIQPVENLMVALVAGGEGWHNYHHVFPWDYKTAELGSYGTNLTLGFIDLCAKLGLAYDLKVVTPEMIKKRMARTGSGAETNEPVQKMIWGWDDPDMRKECVDDVRTTNKVDQSYYDHYPRCERLRATSVNRNVKLLCNEIGCEKRENSKVAGKLSRAHRS